MHQAIFWIYIYEETYVKRMDKDEEVKDPDVNEATELGELSK